MCPVHSMCCQDAGESCNSEVGLRAGEMLLTEVSRPFPPHRAPHAVPHGLLSELPHPPDSAEPRGAGDGLRAGQGGDGAACEGCGEEAVSGGLCFLDGS